jgi:hypothetical protein
VHTHTPSYPPSACLPACLSSYILPSIRLPACLPACPLTSYPLFACPLTRSCPSSRHAQLGEAVAGLWTLALRGRQVLTDFMECLESQVGGRRMLGGCCGCALAVLIVDCSSRVARR